MSKHTIRNIWQCLALAALLALCTACGGGGENAVSTQESQPTGSEPAAEEAGDLVSLRDFSAMGFDGTPFDGEDLAAVDLTMMNIWATWCPPCVGEMPELAAMEKELPDNVQLVTYCVDGKESMDTAQKILEDAAFTGTVLYHGLGDLERLTEEAYYIPMTVFLDSEGHQVCDPIIGAPEDPQEAYLAQINKALHTLGKGMIGP